MNTKNSKDKVIYKDNEKEKVYNPCEKTGIIEEKINSLKKKITESFFDTNFLLLKVVVNL